MSNTSNPVLLSTRLIPEATTLDGLKDAMQRIGFLAEDIGRVAEYLRTRGVEVKLSYAQILALAHNLLEAES